MKPGTLSFTAGAMLTPELIGGKLDARARFNDHLFGFVEARGGHNFHTGRAFGEVFAGFGGEFDW